MFYSWSLQSLQDIYNTIDIEQQPDKYKAVCVELEDSESETLDAPVKKKAIESLLKK